MTYHDSHYLLIKMHISIYSYIDIYNAYGKTDIEYEHQCLNLWKKSSTIKEKDNHLCTVLGNFSLSDM